METEPSYVTNTPKIRDVVTGDSMIRTYMWETPNNDKKIFLYLTLNLSQSNQNEYYFKAGANLDSSDIKGQGNYLWGFLKSQLNLIAQNGINDVPPIPVLHEVHPNKFSLKIVEKDPDYVKKDNLFYHLYNPQTAPTKI